MLQPLSYASGSNSLASSQHLWDFIFKWHSQLLLNVCLLNFGDGMSSSQKSKFAIGSKASAHVNQHGFANGQRASISGFPGLIFSLVYYDSPWDDEVIICLGFSSESIGKRFLKEKIIQIFEILARKLGRHLGKKQHHLFSSKMYFCSISILFFSKDNISVPLIHELFWSKSD